MRSLTKVGEMRCINNHCTDPHFNATRSMCRAAGPLDPSRRQFHVQGSAPTDAGLCACFTDPSQIWHPFKSAGVAHNKRNAKPDREWRWPLRSGSQRIEDELRQYFFGGLYVPGPPRHWVEERYDTAR